MKYVKENHCRILIALLAVGMLTAASSCSKQQQTVAPKKAEDQKVKVGEKITLDGGIVTIISITQPSGQAAPAAGAKPASDDKTPAYLNVSFENTGAGELPYNMLNFEVKDTAGNWYTPEVFQDKMPSLDSGTLAAGGKKQGWIEYEAPANAKIVEVVFSPQWLTGKRISIIAQ